MPYLSEAEWMLVNDMIYSINAIRDDLAMRKQFLESLRVLIPYHCASFYLADTSSNNRLINPVGVDYTDEKRAEYDQYFYQLDFAKNLYFASKSLVYRDTDLLEKNERERSEYFNEYLQPVIEYGGNIILANQNGLLGNITLSRTKHQDDFNERELFIMRQLEPHLTNYLYQVKQQAYAVKSKSFILDTEYLSNNYRLTSREIEITCLMLHGLNNCEISDKLFISPATVKKHMSSIFDKMGSNSRTQLVGLLINQKENSSA